MAQRPAFRRIYEENKQSEVVKLQKSRPKFVRKDLIQVSIGHASTLPPFENPKTCCICQCKATEKELVCSEEGCDTVYHEGCVKRGRLHDYFIYLNDNDAFKCFKHFCNLCFADNKRTSAFEEKDSLHKCTYCSRSYHSDCIPPGFGTTDLICCSHYRFFTYDKPHTPFCVNCQHFYEENEKTVSCDFCIRSFHHSCGQFLVDISLGKKNRLCTYCRYGYWCKEGQFCNVLHDGNFAPAQVVQAAGRPGLIPVKLVTNMNKIIFLPHGQVIPMQPNDAFVNWYIEKKVEGYFAFNALAKILSTKDSTKLPTITIKNVAPDANITKLFMKELLKEEAFTPRQCDCEIENGMKCVTRACLNRSLDMECPIDCGPQCQNNKEQRNPDINKFEIFACPIRGRGLRAKVMIPKDHVIGEYRGHIMTKEEIDAKMTVFLDKRNREDHLYFMLVGSTQLYLDCSRTGTFTRYANHSCDPNVKVGPVITQEGDNIQMLYAKRDIAPKEEITFDYGMNFDEFNTRCHCGSDNCSGYLNGKIKKRWIKPLTNLHQTKRDAKSPVDEEPRKKKLKRKEDDKKEEEGENKENEETVKEEESQSQYTVKEEETETENEEMEEEKES